MERRSIPDLAEAFYTRITGKFRGLERKFAALQDQIYLVFKDAKFLLALNRI